MEAAAYSALSCRQKAFKSYLHKVFLMTTLFGMFRVSSKPTSALTVTAPHLFACRANYVLNVVPEFPAAKAFAPHFFDSYLLIRSVSQESKEPLPVGFGLLSLGVKCHELLPASFSKTLRRHRDMLGPLGLDLHTKKSGEVEVFSPALIGPQLEYILHKPMPTARAMEAGLVEFAAFNTAEPSKYPYELLGWPSLVAPNAAFAINQTDTYIGNMNFPSKPDEFVKTGLLVSAAVAVVEQIMGKLKSLPKIGVFFTESNVAPFCDMPA